MLAAVEVVTGAASAAVASRRTGSRAASSAACGVKKHEAAPASAERGLPRGVRTPQVVLWTAENASEEEGKEETKMAFSLSKPVSVIEFLRKLFPSKTTPRFLCCLSLLVR